MSRVSGAGLMASSGYVEDLPPSQTQEGAVAMAKGVQQKSSFLPEIRGSPGSSPAHTVVSSKAAQKKNVLPTLHHGAEIQSSDSQSGNGTAQYMVANVHSGKGVVFNSSILVLLDVSVMCLISFKIALIRLQHL